MQLGSQHRLTGTILALFAVVFWNGCGGAPDDQPDLGQVSGVVTMDGQPLAGARIFFSPVEGGRTSQATTDEEGNYELRYKGETKGAIIGQHKVRITTYVEGEEDDNGKMSGEKPEVVPEQFSSENPSETRDVKAGDNEIDFEL